MTNAPIGVPSGWEELAAYSSAGKCGWAWCFNGHISAVWYTHQHHDWRVEE